MTNDNRVRTSSRTAGTSNRSTDVAKQYIHRGYVPDSERPERLKYDKEEYIKILKQEAQKRQQVMRQIIETRHLGRRQ
jgi:hypothetical protein